jgi:hypothetical protein
MEYTLFLDSNKHVMASARHFGRIMRRQDSFEKYCSDKTKEIQNREFSGQF